MKNTIKNKKPLLVTTSLIIGTTLILSPMAVAISCRDNQINNEIVEPILPPTTDSPSNPTLPPVENPNSPIVNRDVIANDYLSQETGKKLFDLNVFKGKTLDEINFNLIDSAKIPQDQSKVLSFVVNHNGILIKNKDLNSFTFTYELVLANNSYDYVKESSYMTIYLPLVADSIETLSTDSFKELAQKATNEQYLNSFNETIAKENIMFQNMFTLGGIAFWKSMINQLEEPFLYNQSSFSCDLNNDEILKYTISTNSTSSFAHYREFALTIKNSSVNKYEKITINGNTYLRITMGKDAVELKDQTNNKSYKNINENVFYINITNWNK